MPRYFRHIDMKRFLLFFSVLSFLVSCHHAMIDANQVEQIVLFQKVSNAVLACRVLEMFGERMEEIQRLLTGLLLKNSVIY